MSPEFRLPWEFKDCGTQPDANALVTDESGEFLLKKWQGRLFFRHLRDKGRIFAVATPCDVDGVEIAPFFEHALSHKNVQRLITFPHLWDREDETMLLTLWSDPGELSGKLTSRVEVREWWGGDWVETHVSAREKHSIWHPEWRMSPLPLKPIYPQLQAQVLTEATRHELSLHWTVGSHAELLALAQAFEKACPAEAEKARYARFRPASAWGECEFQRMPLFQPWRGLFDANFKATGIYVNPVTGKDAMLRCGWRFSLPRISVWGEERGEASAHELLEAMLILRDWLRGKLPASQIEEMLLNVRL